MIPRFAFWALAVPLCALTGGCTGLRQNQTVRSAALSVLIARAYDDIAKSARNGDDDGARNDNDDGVREAMKRYAQLDPGNGSVLGYARNFNSAGYELADKGTTPDDFMRAEKLTRWAVGLYDDVIAKNPRREIKGERSITRDSLAWALFRQGKLNEAEKEQREALREARETDSSGLNILTAELPLHLGDILAKQGKIAEARSAYKDALSMPQTEPTAYERARAGLAKLNQPSQPNTAK